MARYRPVLYHRLLSPSCARVRRTILELGLDVELREVLLSRTNRHALRALTGHVRVPCLVLPDAERLEEEAEIDKYLRLRYGPPR
jgi:glutathione S-transferase